MLKTILSFDGAQELSKNEQKAINGGMGPKPRQCCDPELHCCYFQGTPGSSGPCCSWWGYVICFGDGNSYTDPCI